MPTPESWGGGQQTRLWDAAVEMAQTVKHLPLECENETSEPQNPCQSQLAWQPTCNSSAWPMETRSLEQAVQTGQNTSLRVNERLCLSM